MKKKNLGCIGWIVVGLLALMVLPFVVIGGIIYGMIRCYKKGKFDKITAKINAIIDKIFKRQYSKPILSTKVFTIIATILIFVVISAFGQSNESVDADTKNKEIVSEQNQEETTNVEEEEENQEIEEIVEDSEAEIHFIDTGNSDAILIKQGDKSALIDGGDNDDESRVVSYLKEQGISELEYVFATHPDADHIGGLDAVVNNISVKNIYVSNGDASTKTYSDFINAMANKNLNPSVPLLNSEFKLGTSTFKVLSVANESDVNNNSIVLLYTNGEDKVLLMGDASSKIEAQINVEDVDLLKVGHHGSKTSTSSSFIDKINPQYAVITVGENNKYGHPHQETMSTLENKNIEVHRSDECGNIVFKSSGKGISVDCKAASYNAGESSSSTSNNTTNNSNSTTSNDSSTTSNNNSSTSNNTTTSNNNTTTSNNNTTSSGQTQETTPEVSTNAGIVYWTPNGKSYHTTKSCSTLSRSKVINSGTIQQSGKYDPCDRCH